MFVVIACSRENAAQVLLEADAGFFGDAGWDRNRGPEKILDLLLNLSIGLPGFAQCSAGLISRGWIWFCIFGFIPTHPQRNFLELPRSSDPHVAINTLEDG